MIVPADPEHIARAARMLQAGELVAFPTETVYGLGGDATNDRAVAAIYAAKGRPSFNPLIVHVASLAEAMRHAEFPPLAVKLAESFWPGPLTLVLKRRKDCRLSLLLSAGLESVALRVPAHPVALVLLTQSGLAIAGPSANPSGRVSPTTARHVAEGLGDKVALILDGGPCTVGIESTVLGLLGAEPEILRPGGVTAEALADLLGHRVPLAPDAIAGGEDELPAQAITRRVARSGLTRWMRGPARRCWPSAPIRPRARPAAISA
jgi:L-threonylcarbamoyladenylate synthase